MEQAASARLRDARNLTAGSGSTPAVDGRGTRGGAPSPPRMSGDAPGMAAKADIDNLGARVLKTAVSIVPAQAVFPMSGAVRPRQTAPPDWKVSLGGDFSRIFFRPCDKGRSGDLCHGGSPGSLRRRSLGATTAMTQSTGFLRTLFRNARSSALRPPGALLPGGRDRDKLSFCMPGVVDSPVGPAILILA